MLGPLQICVDGAVGAAGHTEAARRPRHAADKPQSAGRDQRVDRSGVGAVSAAGSARQPAFLRSNLRKLLGSVGLDSRTALGSAPPGYRLSVPENDCDIGRFDFGKTAGVQAAATGKFEQACESTVRRAVRMARTRPRRPARLSIRRPTALVEDKVLAHTALAEAEIACGRAYAIIGELESLTAEHRTASRCGHS